LGGNEGGRDGWNRERRLPSSLWGIIKGTAVSTATPYQDSSELQHGTVKGGPGRKKRTFGFPTTLGWEELQFDSAGQS